MNRPRLLDAFCGPGGAAIGYDRAGFDVTGVDEVDQPEYPFAFAKAEALAYIRKHGQEYDFIHTSPPCQAASALSKGTNARNKASYVQLIPATRCVLNETGKPWVIENVETHLLRHHLVLCGEMFGLRVIRHRVFEAGRWLPAQPEHLPHQGRVKGHRHGVDHEGYYFAVYGNGGSGGKGTTAQWQEAMGITHTSNRYSLTQAIPPAYTEFIGRQFLEGTHRGNEAEARRVDAAPRSI